MNDFKDYRNLKVYSKIIGINYFIIIFYLNIDYLSFRECLGLVLLRLVLVSVRIDLLKLEM